MFMGYLVAFLFGGICTFLVAGWLIFKRFHKLADRIEDALGKEVENIEDDDIDSHDNWDWLNDSDGWKKR